MFFIDTAHQSSSRWENLVNEDEDRLLGGQLDTFSDYVDELAYGEVGGDEILLLVDGGDVGLLDLFADYGDAVGVLLSDAFSFSLALLEGVLVLELRSHCDGIYCIKLDRLNMEFMGCSSCSCRLGGL